MARAGMTRGDSRFRGNDGVADGNDGVAGGQGRGDSRFRGNDDGAGGNDGVARGNGGVATGIGPKVVLRADKAEGRILLDSETTLAGVPEAAWRYRLGSRSALEWVLDQYKERKPRDPTIAEKFNTYRFADYKERVIDLLQRVCTVSVRTMEVVDEMADYPAPSG